MGLAPPTPIQMAIHCSSWVKRKWLRVDFAHRFELEVHGSKVRSSEGLGPSSDVVGAAALANPGADCITGKTKLASLLKQGPKRGIPDNTAEDT